MTTPSKRRKLPLVSAGHDAGVKRPHQLNRKLQSSVAEMKHMGGESRDELLSRNKREMPRHAGIQLGSSKIGQNINR